MNIQVFWRLLKQNALLFLLIPVVTAGAAWYFTRNQPKTYKSQATLYTGLVSRYSLMTDRQNNYVDRSANAFDNLLTTLRSKETLSRVGMSLLADHLRLERPDSLVLNEAGFARLEQEVPFDWRVLLPLDGDSVRLLSVIDSLSKTKTDNPIKTLLWQSDSYYAPDQINAKLEASARKNTNDVLLMEYEADDPAVAQQTLRYAINILNQRYATFKTSETNSVVDYYEVNLQKAKRALDQAEARLQDFNVRHKVLDFDEEARNVAVSREELVNQYNQELMRRNAAKAALDALNRRISQQGNVFKVNSDLNEKQAKLTQAESQLANARAYNQPRNVITRLQAAVAQASEELKASAQRYDAATGSPDAVPNQTVAADRLAKTLEYEESVARLELYEKRLSEYQVKTDEYSPLGSQLRQLNRDVSVAEKEYLDLLQNVNQSRTRRQDVAIAGSLEILDAPNFPLGAENNKRWQLVAVGFGVGLFIALLLTILRFLTDNRLHSPEQTEASIGKPVVALFPVVRKPRVYTRTTRAAQSMFEQLLNAINIEIAQDSTRPYMPIITVFSIRSKQGKSWVANGLADLYDDAEQRIAYCYPRVTGTEQREVRKGITFLPYTVRADFMSVTSVEYLLDTTQHFDPTQYDRIILELPALINNQIPVYLMNESALSLLVVDANSVWGRVEKQLLSLYVRVTNQPVLTVLNRVDGNYLVVPNRKDSMPKQGPVPRVERPAQPRQAAQTQRNLMWDYR